MRSKIAAGNWKMNTSLEEGLQLSREIANDIEIGDVITILAVPSTHLKTIHDQLLHVPGMHVAAQNCHEKESGAFTGEISAHMLATLGIPYVVLGHSERRQYANEGNKLLKEKVDIALAHNLKVIFCCGESLAIRKENGHIEFVTQQLQESLWHLDADQLKRVVIAYEPIWAIGTGETASSDQAQEMHQAIRASLKQHFGEKAANDCSILYGGSVKPANAADLFAQEDIDGGLVGGASLTSDSFLTIIGSF